MGKKNEKKGGSYRKENDFVECDNCSWQKTGNTWSCRICGRIANHKESEELNQKYKKQ